MLSMTKDHNLLLFMDGAELERHFLRLSHQTEVEIGSIDVEDAVPFPVVVVMIWQYMDGGQPFGIMRHNYVAQLTCGIK